jgi:hypothetical protein
MPAILRAAACALTVAAVAAPAAQRREAEPDVFARRGVYAETDGGIVELKSYAEGRATNDSVMKAYRFSIDRGWSVPRANVVISFVVNEPGNRADDWMAATQLLFVVGRDVDPAGDTAYQMTAKVTKIRASVYQVMSAELQGPWIRTTYDKALLKLGQPPQPPEAYVGLVIQEWSGQPRRLYPVQVLP